MYIPLPFREQNQAELLKLIEQYPLGTLITVIDGRPEVTHLPFIHLVDTQGESRLCAHVAKGNTVWKAVQDGDEVMVVFQGENAYISPGWYPGKQETHRQVPTWNYQIVHVRGRIRVIKDLPSIQQIVTRLTAQQESGQPQPWSLDQAPPEYIETMLKSIIGLSIQITDITGAMKLSQNKSLADRESVAAHLQCSGRVKLGQAMLLTYPAYGGKNRQR